MNVVSLFSGGGGIDLGFQKAGFKILYSTDVAEIACQTLKHNKVGEVVECKDIREIDFKGLFQQLNVDKIDCLVGGLHALLILSQDFTVQKRKEP